jgi:hypothetical protein
VAGYVAPRHPDAGPCSTATVAEPRRAWRTATWARCTSPIVKGLKTPYAVARAELDREIQQTFDEEPLTGAAHQAADERPLPPCGCGARFTCAGLPRCPRGGTRRARAGAALFASHLVHNHRRRKPSQRPTLSRLGSGSVRASESRDPHAQLDQPLVSDPLRISSATRTSAPPAEHWAGVSRTGGRSWGASRRGPPPSGRGRTQ